MSNPPVAPIRWAPRVSRSQILELYRSEAEGGLDEALLDEVFYGIAARCQSIMEATAAHHGRVKCHACTAVILMPEGCIAGRNKDSDYLLTCLACGWSVTWGSYFRSFQGKQLVAGGSEPYVKRFLAEMNQTPSPREKLLAIDRLIHGFHVWFHENKCIPTRSTGVNVIEGTQAQVFNLIETLAYEDIRDPEIRSTCLAWQACVENHEIPLEEARERGHIS